MKPFVRKYIGDDPSPFISLINKLSFGVASMDCDHGGPRRLRAETSDGKVSVMRVGDVEYVKVESVAVGGLWEMQFNFPETSEDVLIITGIYLYSMYLTIDGVDYYAHYNVDYDNFVLSSSMPYIDYPLYKSEDNSLTDMLLQVENLGFATRDDASTSNISVALSVWKYKIEDSGSSGSPIALENSTFLCEYSFDYTYYDITGISWKKWRPLGGWVVPGSFTNWDDFVDSGWTSCKGKYSIDVTLRKYTEYSTENIVVSYLNNNRDDEDSYSNSGKSSVSVNNYGSIKDDYDYTGVLCNYVNYFSGNTQMNLSGGTTTTDWTWSASWVTTWNDGEEGVTWPEGSYSESGSRIDDDIAYSTLHRGYDQADGILHQIWPAPPGINRLLIVQDWYSYLESHPHFIEVWFPLWTDLGIGMSYAKGNDRMQGEWTFDTDPYGFTPLSSFAVYTLENSMGNSTYLEPVTSINTVLTWRTYESFWGIPGADHVSFTGNMDYSGQVNYETTDIISTEARSMSHYSYQLPFINAVVGESLLTKRPFKGFCWGTLAGTNGSGGSGGIPPGED